MSRKVLGVEDERDIVDILEMALEEKGYVVERAVNGVQGLEKISSFEPDIIVLDIIMEGMDGLTMKTRMKSNVPVIVISACDVKTKEQILAKIKVDKWLEKPFEISDLIDAIKELVN